MGTIDGCLQEFIFPSEYVNLSIDDAKLAPVEYIDECRSTGSEYHCNSKIDSLFCGKERIVSKSVNGKMVIWTLQHEPMHKIQLSNVYSTRIGIRFVFVDWLVSLDYDFAAIGTLSGAILIYDLKTGQKVHQIEHRKLSKPINCCLFTRNSVLCVDEESIMYRFDVLD
jgi:hypothetical protein